MRACDVPRCQNEGTLHMRGVTGPPWWFCPDCAARHAEIAARNGAPGYVMVDETDPASQLPLDAA